MYAWLWPTMPDRHWLCPTVTYAHLWPILPDAWPWPTTVDNSQPILGFISHTCIREPPRLRNKPTYWLPQPWQQSGTDQDIRNNTPEEAQGSSFCHLLSVLAKMSAAPSRSRETIEYMVSNIRSVPPIDTTPPSSIFNWQSSGFGHRVKSQGN